MLKTAASEGILAPDLFKEYAAQWLSTMSAPDHPDVASYFAAESGKRMSYLEFSVQRIIELLSAVGGRRIKARFVLMPDASGKHRFSLVLFAADDHERPLTAYYLPDAALSKGAGAAPAEPVPSGLAGLWEANWSKASSLTPALFATSYGPLEGYNFDIRDFLSPLFNGSPPYADQQVRLLLGLHAYVDATGQPTQTFGLVVRLATAGALADPSDEVDFDLSTPCPPVI